VELRGEAREVKSRGHCERVKVGGRGEKKAFRVVTGDGVVEKGDAERGYKGKRGGWREEDVKYNRWEGGVLRMWED